MKKNVMQKLLSALLIFIFIFSMTSCESGEEPIAYDENISLEIIEENVTYSESFIENANSRFANLMIKITEAYLDINLKENQKQSISENFTTTVLPILYRIKIYEDELDSLLYAAEESITDAAVISPLSLYESALYTIGSRRSGILFFEISLEVINQKAETARTRYEERNEKRYLEDAERCENIISELNEMGAEKFADALSAASFIASTALNLNEESEESAFLLEDAEILFILDRQGEIFSASCLTDKEWQTVGALVNELIPINSSSLEYATLYALKSESYFNNALRVMPEVTALYARVASALKDEAIFSLENEKSENRKALVSAFVSAENEIRALDLALTQYVKTDSKRLKTNVTEYADGEALEAFLGKYQPIDCENLIATLKAISEDESFCEKDLIISYTCGLSPYLAFVLFN